MTPAPRITAAGRMNRVLSALLWIAEHDGPTLAEAARRFGVGEATLLADLELATMIGADSDEYLEMPVEMYVEGDRVFVHLHAFDRPLRLTPAEALALIVAGVAGGGGGGAPGEPDPALTRAVGKLADLLGIDVDDQLDIDLGLGDADVVRALQQAVDQRRAVEIEHVKAESDAPTRRVVEPWTLFRDQGAWYLNGYCRVAVGERSFRVDRILSARVLDEVVDPPADPPTASALRPDADAPRLVLDLEPGARWVVENHPCEAVEERAGGRLRVTLAVVSPPWAERLLLRLGPDATVVSADPPLGPADPGPAAARRVLARYGIGAGEE
ncbi:WYL domain-containing protein [Iamia sp. SCSIO 61187]|uniref:helix-turn-helix transcriptional regulator n=1 Tax=Iamia sp. SCSIO 61187 TaxID=2722752 RepID=UPI001C63AFCD|nr:WYL domain-containing protein [Iamia sp. SCSIO 61187]QYG92913.1 WYL domain-containing protein [Iamia sp. SCSIO 61187]